MGLKTILEMSIPKNSVQHRKSRTNLLQPYRVCIHVCIYIYMYIYEAIPITCLGL
jgi:hypothetical protein